jgi:protocatechuate 3,4-dioxygenase beta subunit
MIKKNARERRGAKAKTFLTGGFAALIFLSGLSLNLACHRAAVADKAEGPVPWNVKIVSDQEPGEPLIVSGTIYSPDGQTPLEGITLYVYQTDATGRYSTSGGDNRATRIHGVMRTNADGRYEFRTIKPASYPNSRNPAHIHAYVSGPGYPEYWIDEYLFAEDPFVTDEARQKSAGQKTFSPILSLTRGSDGILRAVRDIKIERCTRNCTGH